MTSLVWSSWCHSPLLNKLSRWFGTLYHLYNWFACVHHVAIADILKQLVELTRQVFRRRPWTWRIVSRSESSCFCSRSLNAYPQNKRLHTHHEDKCVRPLFDRFQLLISLFFNDERYFLVYLLWTPFAFNLSHFTNPVPVVTWAFVAHPRLLVCMYDPSFRHAFESSSTYNFSFSAVDLIWFSTSLSSSSSPFNISFNNVLI